MTARLQCERWAVAFLLVGAPGCATKRADTGRSHPGEDHFGGPKPAAAKASFEYRSSEREADENPADGDAGHPAKPEALTGFDAYNLAVAAADEVTQDRTIVTPALPTSWPPTSPEVMYLVYPMEPFEGGGVNEYRVFRPALKVVLNLTDRTTTVEELEDVKKLGKIEVGRESVATDPIRGGEDALFAVARAERSVERAAYLLHRYEKWFDDHGVVGADARKQTPEFAAFVAKAR